MPDLYQKLDSFMAGGPSTLTRLVFECNLMFQGKLFAVPLHEFIKDYAIQMHPFCEEHYNCD